jgi:hypothetical protein
VPYASGFLDVFAALQFTSLRLGFRLLLLHRCPFRVFLRDQELDPFRQQRVRIWGICIRRSLPEIDVFLMLKRFAGRTVRNPILRVLVEVQHPFQYGNHKTEFACHQHHS